MRASLTAAPSKAGLSLNLAMKELIVFSNARVPSSQKDSESFTVQDVSNPTIIVFPI